MWFFIRIGIFFSAIGKKTNGRNKIMGFNRSFKIGSKGVGAGWPTFLIAEIGRNHNADMELAKKMITAAANSGADAVKFQSFKAEELLIKELPKVTHIKETSKQTKTAYESTEEVELKPEDHKIVQEFAMSRGIEFFSTPEDHSMVALLDNLKVPVFKIASLDIVYLDLIQSVAETGRPIILSTGMSYLGEIEKALLTLEKHGVENVVILHCTSNYPPRFEDVNLRAIPTLARCFDVPVGYSDHTLGIGVSIAAVALGACVIERHFTLDKNLPGPDQRLSLLPGEFRQMAEEIRCIEKAMGSAIKMPAQSEMEMRRLHRRRLVASHDLESGSILNRKDIACKCSEHGLEPEFLEFLIGRKIVNGMVKDTPFSLSDVCFDEEDE